MWKVLPSNPHYMVSDEGQIKSLRRGTILNPKRNHDGYMRIQLWDKGTCVYIGLHRLIAEAFLPHPDGENIVVNHKNGNKSDNRVANLEWVTQRKNIAHAWKNGLAKQHLNLNGLRVRQLTKSGEFIQEYPSTMEVERTLGICHAHVSGAIKRNGTAGGFRWEVVNV